MKSRLKFLGWLAAAAALVLAALGLVALVLVAIVGSLTNPAVLAPLGAMAVVIVAGAAWTEATKTR